MDALDVDYFHSFPSPSSNADGSATTPVFEAVSVSDMPGTTRTEPCFQVPTPQSSASPDDESQREESFTISVSTAFYPGASIDPAPSDLILVSTDAVFFYVHTHKLLSCSFNKFNSHLPLSLSRDDKGSQPILSVPESSAVLNVVLHTIYNLPFAQYSPATEFLIAAVGTLSKYGIPLREYIMPSTPLYQHLILHAMLNPIEIYILAAQHDLRELAIASSSHLLSFALATITDEMAERMGPVYLKRLFFLHLGRIDALKRILVPPPNPHPPTMICNFTEQKEMVRVWALASAYLAWDARPDLPISTMKHTFNPLIDKLPCDLCQSTLQERIRTMIVQWSVVKNTI